MTNEAYPIEEISLADIHLDRETQVRVTIHEETVRRYFEIMVDEAARDRFPPILLFRDENGKYRLADGHHRVMAAQRRNFKSILAVVRPGSAADAIWEAAGANGRNGLPLGKSDIRRAVEMLCAAFPNRSNRMIAEAVGCNEKTVRKYRSSGTSRDTATADKSAVETRIGKDGKYRPAKTSKGVTVKPAAKEIKANNSEAAPPASLPDTETSETDADQARIEANVKETQISATISQLEIQIAEWFEIAPKDMFEGFDRRLRKRIGELVD